MINSILPGIIGQLQSTPWCSPIVGTTWDTTVGTSNNSFSLLMVYMITHRV